MLFISVSVWKKVYSKNYYSRKQKLNIYTYGWNPNYVFRCLQSASLVYNLIN